MREEQRVEAGAAGEVDGHDVVEGEVAHVAAADDEPGEGGRVDTGLAQQRGVGGDLQQRRHALGARQLGVADQPAVGGALEEVGVADEPAVEERGLVDHLGVGAQRLERLGVGAGEVVGRVAGPLELHDVPRVRPGQPAQLGLLVLVAQGDDPLRHRVVVDDDPLGAAEGDVEVADQGELARRCRAQVARADDEPTVVAEEEHAPNLTPGTDSGPRRRGRRAGGTGGTRRAATRRHLRPFTDRAAAPLAESLSES